MTPLVEMLRGAPEESLDAARALRSLTIDHRENQERVASAGGAEGLVELLRSEGRAQRDAAARALSNLVVGSAGIQAQVGGAGAVRALVSLLDAGDPGASNSTAQAAARALWNLVLGNPTLQAEASCGINALAKLVERGSPEEQLEAIRALGCLADGNDSNKSIIGTARALPTLLELAKQGTAEQKNAAAGALWYLVTDHEEANSALIEGLGGLPEIA